MARESYKAALPGPNHPEGDVVKPFTMQKTDNWLDEQNGMF